MTKTNKPMGFVTLEDIQGSIELVLFPRTWQKTHEQLTVGQIVIVEGKADTGSTPPKILVDEIRTEIKVLEPLDTPTSLSTSASSSLADRLTRDSATSGAQQSKSNGPLQKKVEAKPSIPPPIRQITERPMAYPDQNVSHPVVEMEEEWDTMPPPPDNFPTGWDSGWQPSFENAEIAARPEPLDKISPVKMTPKDDDPTHEPNTTTSRPIEETEFRAIKQDEREQAEVPREVLSVQPIEVVTTESTDVPRSLYIPLMQEEKNKEHPPQQITVMLRSTGDRERDKRRIKTIYGTLISFHGRDRFSFQIFENGKGHLIDFPNDTTRVCTEVLERLMKLMGEESWRVEEITFQ
jgi:DNA polymerase-3 subunit alpha